MKDKKMNKKKRKNYTVPSIKKFKITNLDKIDRVMSATGVFCACGLT